MSKSNRYRLVVKFNNDFWGVLSLIERNNEEIEIFPKFAINYSNVEYGGDINDDSPIKNQHYSIHHSPKSSKGINVIKHTLELVDKEPYITRIFTHAFKKNNLFVPLYSARCQDLSNERYKIKNDNKSKLIELGNYSPKVSSLYYIVIAHNKQVSLKDKYDDINIRTVSFEKYSVTILWSFGMVPSHTTGSKSHFLTIPDEKITSQIKEGFSEIEIVNLYRIKRKEQHTSFLRYLQNTLKDKKFNFNILNNIDFKIDPEFSITQKDVRNITLNQAYNLMIIGKSEENKGNHSKAINLYISSKKIFKELGEPLAYANVLSMEGVLNQSIGYPKKALKSLNEAYEVFKELNIQYQIAQTCLKISYIYRDKHDIVNQKKFVKDALRYSKLYKFKSLIADALKELGIIFKNQRKIINSFYYLTKSRHIYKKEKNIEGEAFCNGNLGLLFSIMNYFKKSYKYHSIALGLFQSIKNEWGIANETANCGNVKCILGKKDEGFEQLENAIKMHKKVGYKYGLATDYKLLGGHYVNYKDISQGKKYLLKSRQLLLEINNNHEAEQVSQIIEKITTANRVNCPVS